MRELISLRCLEQLCGPANVNETTCDVPGSDLGPMFELSCSCEDALGGILQEVNCRVLLMYVFLGAFRVDMDKQFLIGYTLA